MGFYYRTDLNVAGIFGGEGLPEEFWIKLYSYYFVCSMSYLVFRQINRIKDVLHIDENAVCQEVSSYFCFESIGTFAELISAIRKEERSIEIYLNNLPYKNPPMIGAYANLLRDIPKIIFENSANEAMSNKHFIYMVDEFESLRDYQQKAILSLVKYADHYHTYIIGLRSLGLKIQATVGDEYIRETDDYSTYILDDANADYNTFALKVCDKRLELFYKKHFLEIDTPPTVNDFLDPKETIDEVGNIFKRESVRNEHSNRVKAFLDAFNVDDEEILNFFVEKPEQFYLVLLRLIKTHKKDNLINSAALLDEINGFQKMDRIHYNFVHNYKMALVYYLCRLYSRDKRYYGFNTIVNLSGNTLRYLLEMCNEIFLRMNRDSERFYEEPTPIDIDIQTAEINVVSKRRLEQIKAIPDIGPQMRQFMKTFGAISSLYHEDSRLAKWEANHFSIRSASYSNEEITAFLKECVFRGVLVQLEDNKIKVKNYVGYDQYIYKMHSIYTPGFHISFGTKINALGILLFSLSHEGTIDIIYDNPVEDGAAFSEEVGETHVFDISEFIEKAREAEFLAFLTEVVSYDDFEGVPTKIKNYSEQILLCFKVEEKEISNLLEELFICAQERKRLDGNEVDVWRNKFRKKTSDLQKLLRKYCGVIK